LELEGFLYGR
jgi:hypothetical protein